MSIRADFSAIAGWIKPGARVLDLGCGDGALLDYLRSEREVTGYGVEIADSAVISAIGRGVNVLQADLEQGLALFGDGSFDVVILSQTLQAMRHTQEILREMLRVGREGIVSFPNFGYWPHRVQIALGRMPVSKTLPYQWYNTPNIHLCTIEDFRALVASTGGTVVDELVLTRGERVDWLPNLRGELALGRIKRR